MIAKEFDEIRRILSGRYKLCEDSKESFRWFESLKAYEFSIVKEAVNDWIVSDGWKPEVVNIVDRCNDVLRWRRQSREAAEPNVKTVACPICRDSGLVVKTSPTGIRVGTPCTACKMGQLKYPWEFLSDDQKQQYNEREIKAGRQVPKIHEAPKNFYNWYVNGIETK